MYLCACVFRVLVVLVGFAGVSLQIIESRNLVTPFVYFTIQSSAFVTVCFALTAWATLREGRGLLPAVKGAATVYILITGLVFNLVLAEHHRDGDRPPPPAGRESAARPEEARMRPPDPPLGARSAWPFVHPGFLMHVVLPLMVLADWLFFDPHRRYRWRYAALWLLYPLGYLVFILIRHGVFPESRFPYSFVDVDHIGYGGLAVNVLAYGVAFYALGLTIVGIDRLLPSPRKGGDGLPLSRIMRSAARPKD